MRNLEIVAECGGLVDPPEACGDTGGSGGPIIGGGALKEDDGDDDDERATFDSGQYLMPGGITGFSGSQITRIRSIELNANLDEDEIEDQIGDIVDE